MLFIGHKYNRFITSKEILKELNLRMTANSSNKRKIHDEKRVFQDKTDLFFFVEVK